MNGVCVFCLLVAPAQGFALGRVAARQPPAIAHRSSSPQLKDEGTKGAVGGAVLGGLLAGPFGALWGAQLGGAMGSADGQKKQMQERLDKVGLDKATLRDVQIMAQELADAEEALTLVQRSADSQRAVVASLEAEAARMYSDAEALLKAGDEDAARAKLTEKRGVTARLASAELEAAQASDRVSSMERSRGALEQRALQVQALVDRALASEARGGAGGGGSSFELEPEDPLLARFRDLEGK